VPDARRGPQRVTYRSDGITAPGRDRFTYRRRIAQTIVVLVVLAVILWWAFGALGDGLGAVLDLFRGEPDPVPTTEALGVVRPG
jgi:hypothetical protein